MRAFLRFLLEQDIRAVIIMTVLLSIAFFLHGYAAEKYEREEKEARARDRA
jgi:hypothetical protein